MLDLVSKHAAVGKRLNHLRKHAINGNEDGFDMPRILDKHLMSKGGDSDGGADRLVLGPHFFGVIDGATDKRFMPQGTAKTPKYGGAVLADIVRDVLSGASPNCTPSEIVEQINERILDAAEQAGIDLNDVNNRSDVGFAVYVPTKNAVYHIHDCNFGFLLESGDFDVQYNEKSVDRLTSSLRAQAIGFLRRCGIEPFDVKEEKDFGREFILPLLERQPELQNADPNDATDWLMGLPRGLLTYKTLNGFPTSIDVTPVPAGTLEVVLASDGFKVLKPTCDDTLDLLKQQLEKDAECTGVLRSTKGLQGNNVSFDDTSYLRVKVG